MVGKEKKKGKVWAERKDMKGMVSVGERTWREMKV